MGNALLYYLIVINVVTFLMKVWHHKTKHKKFKYGLPLILLTQIALLSLTS